MASSSSLSSSLTFISPNSPKPKLPSTQAKTYVPIRCGAKGPRGPLVKGRILSIEAIQAVQSLKRLQNLDNAAVSKTLSRLIKSDLLAALNELLRQDRCDLALKVFYAVRSEYKMEMSSYADMVLGLSKKMMWEDIDRLIADLEGQDGVMESDESSKGIVRLVKALVEAGRVESTVRIYEMMKRSGWGGTCTVNDEYLVKVLSRGLRRLGEVDLADEVQMEFGKVPEGSLGKIRV